MRSHSKSHDGTSQCRLQKLRVLHSLSHLSCNLSVEVDVSFVHSVHHGLSILRIFVILIDGSHLLLVYKIFCNLSLSVYIRNLSFILVIQVINSLVVVRIVRNKCLIIIIASRCLMKFRSQSGYLFCFLLIKLVNLGIIFLILIVYNVAIIILNTILVSVIWISSFTKLAYPPLGELIVKILNILLVLVIASP